MVRTSRCGRDNPYSTPAGDIRHSSACSQREPLQSFALLLFHANLDCGSSRGGSSNERSDYGRATTAMDLMGRLAGSARARGRSHANARGSALVRTRERPNRRAMLVGFPRFGCLEIPARAHTRLSSPARTPVAPPLAREDAADAPLNGMAAVGRGRLGSCALNHFPTTQTALNFWFICFHPKAILRSFAASQAFKVSILRSLQTVCVMRAGHPRELHNLFQCLASHHPNPSG